MNGHDDDDDRPSADIIEWPKGPDPAAESPPDDEAEALVLKALSSITGRDPADLLEEIRRREAEPPDPRVREPSNVVDLAAIRQARQREQDSSAVDLGDVMRAGFRAIMEELIARRPPEGELVIDSRFVREHGTEVLGSVFQSVGKAFLAQGEAKNRAGEAPSDGEPSAETPTGPETDTSVPEPEPEPITPDGPVAIRFDIGSLAGSILSRLGLFRGSIGHADPAPARPEAPAELADTESPDDPKAPEDPEDR